MAGPGLPITVQLIGHHPVGNHLNGCRHAPSVQAEGCSGASRRDKLYVARLAATTADVGKRTRLVPFVIRFDSTVGGHGFSPGYQ